jgi:monovalent cation/hydrogen antiporter
MYLIEGLVFLYTGLQMRTLVERVHAGELESMLVATSVAAVIVVVARYVWVFPAIYVPRWASKKLAARDPSPPWQAAFMVAFTGIRGVVSLAAALALPMTTSYGQPFPDRDLILFVVFAIIVVTLIGQGLYLPRLIRRLGLARGGDEEHQRELDQERDARAQVVERSVERLEAIASQRELPDELVAHVRTHIDTLGHARTANELRLELIAEDRQLLHRLLRDGKLSDESRRRLERELDLEEEMLRHNEDVAL